MFEADERLEGTYGGYFASSAYSEFRPVSQEATEQGYRQNRRIEISVVLKDAGVRDVIDQYMENLNPMLQAPSAPATPTAPTDPVP
jgi:chemotaxis protein MotB